MKMLVLAALVALPAAADEVSPPPAPPASDVAPQNWDTPGVKSAGKGALGIRAGFGASISTMGLSTGVTPTLNGVWFITDNLALVALAGIAFGVTTTTFNNGFVTASGTEALFGFTIGGGIDWYFRSPNARVRPLVGGQISLYRALDQVGNGTTAATLGIALTGSLGLAYFFSPGFSVDARLAVGVPFSFGDTFSVSLVTLTPGLGATVLF